MRGKALVFRRLSATLTGKPGAGRPGRGSVRESWPRPEGKYNACYLLAAIGTLIGSGGALGIVVTRPAAPLVGVAVADGGAGVAAINPRALRTSVSSFAITSLLSFRNWRAFSRPWP